MTRALEQAAEARETDAAILELLDVISVAADAIPGPGTEPPFVSENALHELAMLDTHVRVDPGPGTRRKAGTGKAPARGRGPAPRLQAKLRAALGSRTGTGVPIFELAVAIYGRCDRTTRNRLGVLLALLHRRGEAEPVSRGHWRAKDKSTAPSSQPAPEKPRPVSFAAHAIQVGEPYRRAATIGLEDGSSVSIVIEGIGKAFHWRVLPDGEWSSERSTPLACKYSAQVRIRQELASERPTSISSPDRLQQFAPQIRRALESRGLRRIDKYMSLANQFANYYGKSPAYLGPKEGRIWLASLEHKARGDAKRALHALFAVVGGHQKAQAAMSSKAVASAKAVLAPPVSLAEWADDDGIGLSFPLTDPDNQLDRIMNGLSPEDRDRLACTLDMREAPIPNEPWEIAPDALPSLWDQLERDRKKPRRGRLRIEQRHADPSAIDFWRLVVRGPLDACWGWIGSISSEQAGLRPVYSVNGRLHTAARWGWALIHGVFPEGRAVRHSCHHVICMNPRHWYTSDDSRATGSNSLTLTTSDRERFLGLCREHVFSMRVLAATFGIPERVAWAMAGLSEGRIDALTKTAAIDARNGRFTSKPRRRSVGHVDRLEVKQEAIPKPSDVAAPVSPVRLTRHAQIRAVLQEQT